MPLKKKISRHARIMFDLREAAKSKGYKILFNRRFSLYQLVKEGKLEKPITESQLFAALDVDYTSYLLSSPLLNWQKVVPKKVWTHERMVALRNMMGLTKHEMAEYLGVARQTYNNHERPLKTRRRFIIFERLLDHVELLLGILRQNRSQ